MEATELRIGNYLKYNSEIKQVSSIHNDNTIRFKDGSSSIGCFIIKNENIKPIPLTEEILLKCGFEFINNTFYRSRNSELCLYNTASKNKMIPDYYGKRLVTGYDFKYLHQLQNLYYALTGEELTINL